MVTRVYKNRRGKVPKGQVLEISGRQELVVQVAINEIKYQDWISIETFEGSIEFKGGHVHELVNAILRFSSKRARNRYKELLTLTDHVTGSEPYQPEPPTYFDIGWEKNIRKRVEEWEKRRLKELESLNETS